MARVWATRMRTRTVSPGITGLRKLQSSPRKAASVSAVKPDCSMSPEATASPSSPWATGRPKGPRAA